MSDRDRRPGDYVLPEVKRTDAVAAGSRDPASWDLDAPRPRLPLLGITTAILVATLILAGVQYWLGENEATGVQALRLQVESLRQTNVALANSAFSLRNDLNSLQLDMQKVRSQLQALPQKRSGSSPADRDDGRFVPPDYDAKDGGPLRR